MKSVICDYRIPNDMTSALKSLEFEPILLPPSKKLEAPIASHTDMLIFKLGNTVISEKDYIRDNPEIFDKLTSSGVTTLGAKEGFGSSYPDDAILNALVIGSRIFCKANTVSDTLKELALESGYTVVPVRQGYAACTVLPLGNSAAITADKGMARVLSDEGIRVTLIRNSRAIKLIPYEYGFIGGCAGSFGDTVYFLGNLKAHEDYDIIEKAICDVGLRSVSLYPACDFLLDLGGLRFCD